MDKLTLDKVTKFIEKKLYEKFPSFIRKADADLLRMRNLFAPLNEIYPSSRLSYSLGNINQGRNELSSDSALKFLMNSAIEDGYQAKRTKLGGLYVENFSITLSVSWSSNFLAVDISELYHSPFREVIDASEREENFIEELRDFPLFSLRDLDELSNFKNKKTLRYCIYAIASGLNAANSFDRRIDEIFHQIHEMMSRYFAHPLYGLDGYEHEMRIFCAFINRKLNEWRQLDGLDACDEYSLFRTFDLFK